MDPTAPNDNDQDPSKGENQQQTPVQTGGFVVSGEQGATPSQLPQNPQIQQPSVPSSMPSPQAAADLQSDLQSTVAAATGTSPIGTPEPIMPPSQQAVASQEASLPPIDQQPDPTPFMSPQQQSPQGVPQFANPTPAGTPQPQAASQDSGSNAGKMKSLIIVVAVFILVAILAAVAWYFVLNKGQSSQDNSATDNLPLDLPSSPSPKTNGGFGTLPTPTPEASAPADVVEGSEEVVPPAETTQ